METLIGKRQARSGRAARAEHEAGEQFVDESRWPEPFHDVGEDMRDDEEKRELDSKSAVPGFR